MSSNHKFSNVYPEGDNVSFDDPNAGGTKHKPLLENFPFLAEPN